MIGSSVLAELTRLKISKTFREILLLLSSQLIGVRRISRNVTSLDILVFKILYDLTTFRFKTLTCQTICSLQIHYSMNSMNSQSRYFCVLRQNLKHTRQHFTPETFFKKLFWLFLEYSLGFTARQK